MLQIHTVRRFRANPIEVLIFLVTGVVLLNSVYNLVYGNPGFHLAALSRMSANPVSEGRSLASVPQRLLSLEVPCEPSSDQATASNKIRLSGHLCGATTEHTTRTLIKSEITNSSNQFVATVFSDTENNKFSTDYIPLSPGKNPIHIVFSYQDGKTAVQDVMVIKD